MTTNTIGLGFVCVQNAGRSQMATAFAERERTRRGLEETVDIRTGGTHPADAIHEEVREAMAAVGIDLSDRSPREIATSELEACEVVATMGCSTLELDAAVDIRDWALEDPDGKSPADVADIRDEVERRVSALFDEIERDIDASSSAG